MSNQSNNESSVILDIINGLLLCGFFTFVFAVIGSVS